MNEKEVAELRRRFRQDKSGISHVRGCYVNQNKEIVSQFDQSLGVMTQEENEKILALLKKTLSGGLGKNLLDITFATQQVVSGAEHKLLMALRDSRLEDEEAVQAFFQKVIASVTMEGNYMVLLVHDAYDVPFKGKDGEKMEDASEEVFSYILCSICPVKQTKPALSYYVQENQFHNLSPDWVVAPPELGFLFPAFDDRSTNLYNALYYNKNAEDVHEDFIAAVFATQPPMPAALQKETFREASPRPWRRSAATTWSRRSMTSCAVSWRSTRRITWRSPWWWARPRCAKLWRPTESPRSAWTPFPGSTTRPSASMPSSRPGTWWTPSRWS